MANIIEVEIDGRIVPVDEEGWAADPLAVEAEHRALLAEVHEQQEALSDEDWLSYDEMIAETEGDR